MKTKRFMVGKMALEQLYFRVSSVYPRQSSLHHCFILVCHRLLRCEIPLITQHNITSHVFKFGGFITDLALGWLQNEELKFL
jgi:hypothetical protein